MSPLREPRAYQFARQLGRAMENTNLLMFIGAGWVTAGAWKLNEAAGYIVLGAFFLTLALMVAIRNVRQGQGQ